MTDYELWSIGPLGFQEEHRYMILYQCPRCKTVVIDAGYDTKYCEVCKAKELAKEKKEKETRDLSEAGYEAMYGEGK